MGGFFLGAGLLRSTWEMDRQPWSWFARHGGRAVGDPALEWFILVPLFPFWQPIFTLQQPYWIVFLVHLSSASMYPLFAWLRCSPSERKAFGGRMFSPGLEPWNYSPPTGRRMRRDVLPATGRSGRLRSHTIGP